MVLKINGYLNLLEISLLFRFRETGFRDNQDKN